jgi:DNA-binding NarL/FixJ family response regulator
MSPNPKLALDLAAGPLRIYLASGDPLARVGLAGLVELRSDVVVVERPEDANVALWDPGPGRDVAAARLAEIADMPVPVVALLPDRRLAAQSLAAGARGAIARQADGASLLAALIAARYGFTIVDPSFALPIERPTATEQGDLTHREREVLELLAGGLSNKEIAQRLTISDHTAKFHVNGILAKLGAQTRTEAVVLAARRGMLSL